MVEDEMYFYDSAPGRQELPPLVSAEAQNVNKRKVVQGVREERHNRCGTRRCHPQRYDGFFHGYSQLHDYVGADVTRREFDFFEFLTEYLSRLHTFRPYIW